jgi:hypothetical protein
MNGPSVLAVTIFKKNPFHRRNFEALNLAFALPMTLRASELSSSGNGDLIWL